MPAWNPRANAIFEEVVECLPSQQEARLDELCGGDARLREEAAALLRSHRDAGGFLSMPLINPDDQTAVKPPGQEAPEAAGGPDPFSLNCLQPSARPDSLGRLGHYEVLEVVGAGGMGVVVRAFDDRLHRVVAVKIMSAPLAATSPPRKRFLREARAAAAIRHENVVDVHAVEDQPVPYLVMEYVAGQSLQQRIDRHGPLDVSQVTRIGAQIARGLAAAHALGLIHRDVKPANVLLEEADRVKIADFGLARTADDASLTQSGFIAGTPLYMSPEQARGKAVDHRSDLFSLGSVLYVMCTGRPPFRAPTTLGVLERVAEEVPRPMREIIPELPQWLCDLVGRLHAKDPAARLASAREVADLLERSQAPAAPRARQRRLPWVAAGAVLALLVCGAVLALGRWAATPRGQVGGAGEEVEPGAVIKPAAAVEPAADADREAARYVLSVGGRVRVSSVPGDVVVASGLPEGPFRLTAVVTNNCEKLDDAGLACFRGCRHLEILSLVGTKVTDRGLAHFAGCKGLEELHLGWTKTGDAGLAHFSGCEGLVTLSLLNTQVGDAGMSHFARCKDLVNLDLTNTQVSDKGLAHFDGCTRLRMLTLSRTGVTDKGLAHFDACKDLQDVTLAFTRIGDEGLAHFQGRKSLESLHLAGTDVSDVGLPRLEGSVNLRKLYLHATRVTGDGVARASKALPRCRIEWDKGKLGPTDGQ